MELGAVSELVREDDGQGRHIAGTDQLSTSF